MKCKTCGFSIRSNKKKSESFRIANHEAGEHHKKKHPKYLGFVPRV